MAPPFQHLSSSCTHSSYSIRSKSNHRGWWSFVASSIMYGVVTGVTVFVLQQQQKHQRVRNDESPYSSTQQRQLTAICKSLEEKLPLIVWMSLFVSLLSQPTQKFYPQQVVLASLLLGELVGYHNKDNNRRKEDHSRKEGESKEDDRNDLLIPPHHHHHRHYAATRSVPLVDASWHAPPLIPSHHHHPLRRLELLVHNISHTDLILSLQPNNHLEQSYITVDWEKKEDEDDEQPPPQPQYRLCRPRFSCFDKYSRQVLQHLSTHDRIMYLPRHDRRRNLPQASDNNNIPAGIALQDGPAVKLDEVRVRDSDRSQLREGGGGSEQSSTIQHVFFPLLATLLPRWKEEQIDSCNNASKRVLILVSGVGSPRNETHDVTANSTQSCAELMERFLQRIDPDLTVVRVHGTGNIFRYDDNLVFGANEFMPVVLAYRDAHARGLPYPDETMGATTSDTGSPASDELPPFAPDWRQTFHTTLSFADGSPARTYVLQQSLRPFKPTYIHFWQLKTFWHQSKLVNDDIEVHSFEAMETIPAVDAQVIEDPAMRRVVHEITAFGLELQQTLHTQAHDMERFWLRKTHKPVVAVLLVQFGGTTKLYRGTNMEVSMPTGSLCAERNVIGSALADRPCLKREELKLMAVLAVPWPSILSRAPSVSQLVSSSRKLSMGSETDTSVDESNPSTPLRKIALTSATAPKRTVVFPRDLNPLKPCGACNEWLKKIAECNPYFKILTFTDVNCNGVYITLCQE